MRRSDSSASSANSSRLRSQFWKRRWSSVGFVVFVLGACLVVRLLDAPDAATAQSARKSADPPRTVPKPTKPTVVAVVNGQKISRVELGRECIRRHGTKVLESEINKRLILAECKGKGIKITNADIEAEVARMANKFGLSVGRWLAMLQDERDISAFQYKRDIVWPTLALRRLAKSSLQVTDEDLQLAYESEYGPMVQVRLISTKSGKKAQQLRAQAAAHPDNFDRLAKDHSEDENSAAARGLIPPVRKNVGDPTVVKTAFALREGEVSPVIQAAGQYLILKCEQHVPPRQLGPQQREQVMGELRDAIADKKLRTAASQIFRQLQDRAEIVNVLDDPQQKRQHPGAAAIVNGQQITRNELGEQCILRYGKEVLDAEVNRHLLVQAMDKRSLKVQQAEIRDEIERAAESYAFLKKDGSVDVDGWLAHVTEQTGSDVDVYIRDSVWPSIALKKIVRSAVKVNESDLKKAFLANYGERVEALAIVLSNQRTAHEVFDLARSNSTDKFFGELAHQYSIEPVSRANFGQVPPIRMHGGQPLLEKEAFSLQPGEVSGVIASGDKFVILRCLGRTKPVVENMGAVHDELVKDLCEKKLRVAMSEEFDRIKAAAQIDNFLEGTVQVGRNNVAQKPARRTKVQPASVKR